MSICRTSERDKRHLKYHHQVCIWGLEFDGHSFSKKQLTWYDRRYCACAIISLFQLHFFHNTSQSVKINLEKSPFQNSYRTEIMLSSYIWRFDPSRTMITYWANKQQWSVIESLLILIICYLQIIISGYNFILDVCSKVSIQCKKFLLLYLI
jgi:hypothetical protein